MKRALAMFAVTVLVAAGYGCKSPIPGTGNGGGGGAWKPDKCFNNAFMGDVADLKEGRYLTYVTEASGTKTTMKYTVVGKDGDNWCVEQWTDAGSMAYGLLLCVAADGKVVKASAAAKGDKEWTEIKVEEPPAAPTGDQPKPEMTVSDDTKEVTAGKFAGKKIHTKMTISGTVYESDSWFSADVWKLSSKGEHGGLVAMESGAMKMSLEAKGEDGKATIEMKKK
ncbi:MAG: hypothetical protein HYY17_09855 [Planctomycetes bacterium]|nr:hypothetical protein [Planctomycetota bacterium]